MKRTFLPLVVSLIIFLLTVMCIPGPPGSQQRVDRTVVVNVFTDVDGSGRQDKDEPGIPGALIAYRYNEHGYLARGAKLSGTDGQVTISGTYTHFFDVGVLAPCGYQPTSETTQSAANAKTSLAGGERQLDFGFLPPSNGTFTSDAAQITFELWQDLDGNGQRSADEAGLGGQPFAATPYNSGAKFLWPDPANMDYFALTSEPDGTAQLDLGNSCGQIAVRFPLNSGPEVTASQPPPGSAEEAEDILVFAYQTGLNLISIGLKPE